MGYYRKSYELVGYTYQSEYLCPSCTIVALHDEGRISEKYKGVTADIVIEAYASNYGGERDVPHPIFADHLKEGDLCECCGWHL